MRPKAIFLTALLLLLATAGSLLIFNRLTIPAPKARKVPPPDATYEAAQAFIESDRVRLAQRLAAARTDQERKTVLDEAHRAFANGICDRLAPWWEGTPWDFNGITQTPGKGEIACGYYVSTLLKHAGLKIERVRLAQQASLHIIQSLIGKDELVKGHGVQLPVFIERLRTRGPGLYVVGLDNHTGFIWNDGNEVWFLHSTVAGKCCVVNEQAAASTVLGNSKYRAAGYLSGNDALMIAWLNGQSLPTKLPGSTQ